MAEYLSEEEQLAQLKGWWQSYGWWLVGAIVLGLGGYFGLQYMEGRNYQLNAAASEVYERYQEIASDEAAAAPLLARLDGEYAGTAYQVMSLLSRGQIATDAGDIEAAAGFYETAANSAKVDHLSDVARLRLARSMQQLGKSDEAFAALASVQGEGYRSLVAELKGDILREQDKPEEAREAYAAAVESQGENPRVLLAMKLAELSPPDGGPEVAEPEADADTGTDAGVDAETAVEGVVDNLVDGGAAAELLNEAEESVSDIGTDAASAVDTAIDSVGDAAEAVIEEVSETESN